MAKQTETLVILDFGSQYTQLIARRARELGVFSLILPFNVKPAEIQKHGAKAIILSGGPNSVYAENAPRVDNKIFRLGLPVLGICYGLQLIAQDFGGKVAPGAKREYGLAKLNIRQKSSLLPAKSQSSTIWMSHGDHVSKLPRDFKVTAMSGETICAIENLTQKIFGLQFHPEVAHSTYGPQILANFLRLCDFKTKWRASSIIDEQISTIKQKVGQHNVVCALSGGVDSSIAATLVNRALGAQQTCIFVDNGLLRQDEYEEVLEIYKKTGLRVRPIRAAQRFLSQLKGVTDPEKKRKIIGREFISIFDEEAAKIKGVKFLVQGTLYPDIIESVSVNGPSVTIKSHHNVGGLPKKMNLQLIEPLREIFKDEVRLIGRELGLHKQITDRQAFPGPGLAVRVVGEITARRLNILRQADAIVRQEIEGRPAIRRRLYQYFAVLLPVKSVGVMGDGRTYEYAVAVKAFDSPDAMTTNWARLPYDLLDRISSRIVNEVRGVNRIVYEITAKPPATIEWE